TYCGVFRRYLLNREARELSADVLVLGHNLDDFAQSVLMNFVNADLEKLARIAPHLRIQEGLVPRLLPLRLIPEKEVMLYAMLNNLELCLDRCPYAFSNRFIFRRIIYELEDLYPGTRHKIVKVYDQIKPYLYELFPSEGMRRCKLCGEPSSKEICKACELRMRLGLV
ncbi:MAG: TIGR00269 family protein, partial [Thermoplasmata archaeon]